MPHLTKSLALVFAISCLPVATSLAQTWISEVTNADWNVATNWSPATIPGALATDVATIPSTVAGDRNIRITDDRGTIDSLFIGGGEFGGNTVLQVRGNGQRLAVTNDVTIGGLNAAGNTQRVGRLDLNNNNSLMQIGGDILSGSTSGGNRIFIQGQTNSALTLTGDIDPGGAKEIDLIINRGTLILNGVGAQTLNVEQFDVLSTGANLGDLTFQLDAMKTINTGTPDSDIGRVANNNRNFDATFTVLGTASYGGNLIVGSVAAGAGNTTGDATGILNVGAATGGTVTVANEMRLAVLNAATQTAVGTVNVQHADSLLTVANGVEMGSQDGGGGTNSATLNVSAGRMQIAGDITDSALGSSTINLSGTGELDLDAPSGVQRAVDTFDFTGGVLDVYVSGGDPTLSTTDTTLSAGAGGSIIDITFDALPPDSSATTAIDATWDGANGDWTTAINWDNDTLPNATGGAIATGTVFTLVNSTNGITNQGNAALDASDVADWTLDQANANTITVERTGAPVAGSGVVAAVIDTAVTVTRTTDLNIQNAAGQSADATQLTVSNGATLDLTGGSDLRIGGAGGTGTVDQNDGGTSVNVAGDLLFSGTEGGIYNLNGGDLNVTGDIIEGDSGAPDDTVANAQMHVDGGNLSVTGDITVQSFRVGNAAGSNGSFTLGAGKTLTNTGTMHVGTSGTGTFTADPGSTVNMNGGTAFKSADTGGNATVTFNGATVNSAGLVAFGESDTGGVLSSTVNIEGGTVWTQTAGEFRNAPVNGSNGAVNIRGAGTVLNLTAGNFESGQNGIGTVVIEDGAVINLNAANFIVSQAATSNATVTVRGAATTLNLNGGDGNRLLNFNQGIGVMTQENGTVHVGNNLNLGNNANSDATYNLQDGLLTVGGNLDFRNNGDDEFAISGGTLDFNGVASAIHFGNRTGTNAFTWTGGRIEGLVTFNGDLTQTGATSVLAPGSSPGSTAVIGAYSITDGSIEIEIDSDGAGNAVAGTDFDQINVTGAVTLTNATIALSAIDDVSDLSAGTTLTILHSDTSITGEFNNITDGEILTLGNNNFEADYTGTDFNLTVIPEPSASLLGLLAASALLLTRHR